MPHAKPQKPLKLIWDIPVRVCHWAMVVLLIMQWVTTEKMDDGIVLHSRLGYGFIGVVLFRILWGFIGTHYALFSQFIASPARVIAYAKGSLRGSTVVYTGHNPLGGWMVVLLLGLLLIQGLSGLFMSDDIFFTAPYFDLVSKDVQSIMAWIHHTSFTVIQVAVALHIGAVLFYVTRKKQPLISAMLHGKKRTRTRAAAKRYWRKALLCVLLIVAVLVVAIEVLPPEPVVEDWY